MLTREKVGIFALAACMMLFILLGGDLSGGERSGISIAMTALATIAIFCFGGHGWGAKVIIGLVTWFTAGTAIYCMGRPIATSVAFAFVFVFLMVGAATGLIKPVEEPKESI